MKIKAIKSMVNAIKTMVNGQWSMVNIIMAVIFPAIMTTSCICDTINEDLDNCGTDFTIDYTLRLVTNIETELNTVLSTDVDQEIADALRDALTEHIFREFAEDVNLSFYNTSGEQELLQQEKHQMNAGEASYTIYLPARDYMHLAVANIAGAQTVTLEGDGNCPDSKLVQQKGDTIDSHATGLFTARVPMEVMSDQDQDFLVTLYMANSAAAIVIDTTGCNVREVRTFINKVGDGFCINDSTYTHTSNSVIRMNNVTLPATTNSVCNYGVCFPSDDDGEWEIFCYVTLDDGTITETILTVETPLEAGQFKIIKAQLSNDGSVVPVNASDVGASVTLDWKSGGGYNPSF